MLTLVVGVAIATVTAASILIDRSAHTDLAASLARDRQAFDDLQGYRQTLFRSQIRVVAEEPRLKAVAATEEITHETVLGVARELKVAVGCDLFLITDGDGRLLADVADASASGFDMASNPLVARALSTGQGDDIWTDAKAAYQVEAQRLDFGKTVVGVLVIGFKLDDAVARAVSQQTGGSVVVLMGDAPIAVSFPNEVRRPSDADVQKTVGSMPTATSPVEVTIGDGRFLATASAFPGYHGERPLRCVLLRSLDRALELRRALSRVLYLVLAAATVLAFAVSLALSRRLSRPIDELVRFTGAIGRGNLTAATTVSGPQEIRSLGEAMNRMVVEIVEGRAKLAAQEQLRKELEIAAQIQTSIVPEKIEVPGMEVAARMLAAADVGGDYYDFINVKDGCWVGVGDVAGHGLTAGLIMMMIQSVVASLTRANPSARPKDLVSIVNEVMFDNIRSRLKQGEHVTFCLAHYRRDGQVTFAGAHEEIIVCPADGGPCRRMSTPGTWLGAVHDIARFTTDSELRLQKGDLLVFYTDGITEAMDDEGQQFGIDRLCAEIEAARRQPTAQIRDRVLAAATSWSREQADDITLVVMRHLG
jgi:sigma-B regulation protein RsbU (phosphoserine phosphatase)